MTVLEPSCTIDLDQLADNEEDVRVKYVEPYLISLGHSKRRLFFETPPAPDSRKRIDVSSYVETMRSQANSYLFIGEIKWADRNLSHSGVEKAKNQLKRYYDIISDFDSPPIESYLFVGKVQGNAQLKIYIFDKNFNFLPNKRPRIYTDLLREVEPRRLDHNAKLQIIESDILEIKEKMHFNREERNFQSALKSLNHEKSRILTDLRKNELGAYLTQARSTFPSYKFDTESCLIGEGFNAYVIRAFDPDLQLDLAVKIIRMSLRNDPKVIERMQRAYFKLKQLRFNLRETKHLSHIIQTIGDFKNDGFSAGYAMEFIPESTTLKSAVRYMTELERLKTFQKILETMEACQEHNILHRDLHPDNILIKETRSGDDDVVSYLPIITDFDMLVENDPLNPPYPHDQRHPNYDFSAPEVRNGEKSTIESEMYSIGAVLWFSLTGKRNYHEGEVDDWSTSQGHVSFGQESVIIHDLLTSMCSYHPSERPAIDAVKTGIQTVLRRFSKSITEKGKSKNGYLTPYEKVAIEISGSAYKIIDYQDSTTDLFSYCVSYKLNSLAPALVLVDSNVSQKILEHSRRDISNRLVIVDFTQPKKFISQIDIFENTDRLEKPFYEFFRGKVCTFLEIDHAEFDFMQSVYFFLTREKKRISTLYYVYDEILTLIQSPSRLSEFCDKTTNQPEFVHKLAESTARKLDRTFSEKNVHEFNQIKKGDYSWFFQSGRPVIVVTNRPVPSSKEELIWIWFLIQYIRETSANNKKPTVYLASDIDFDTSMFDVRIAEGIVLKNSTATESDIIYADNSNITITSLSKVVKLDLGNDSEDIFPRSIDILKCEPESVRKFSSQRFSQPTEKLDRKLKAFLENATRKKETAFYNLTQGRKGIVTGKKRNNFLPGKTKADLTNLYTVLAKMNRFDGWDDCMLALSNLAISNNNHSLNAKLIDVAASKSDLSQFKQRKINNLINHVLVNDPAAFNEAKSLIESCISELYTLDQFDRYRIVNQFDLAWYFQKLEFVHRKARIRRDRSVRYILDGFGQLYELQMIKVPWVGRWYHVLNIIHCGASMERALAENEGLKHLNSGWPLVGIGDACRAIGQKENALSVYDQATDYHDTKYEAEIRGIETSCFSDNMNDAPPDSVIQRLQDFVRRDILKSRATYLLSKAGIVAEFSLEDDFVDELEHAIISTMKFDREFFHINDLNMFLLNSVPNLRAYSNNPSTCARLLRYCASSFSMIALNFDADGYNLVVRRKHLDATL